MVVEVVYADADRQVLLRVELPHGSSVKQVIDLSGIAGELPDGVVDLHRLGVFGDRVAPDRTVQNGDRIEIYRPLLLDPMEARRRRAR
ncbi:RnfH family protein [Rhodanobacter umsongensis]|uniref:UPF0125 protein ACFPME_00695 n=1 Tax=Rhodanobacter umsongensis TaxID=633153 RepID=A0ABW0JH18_9GAMM